LRLTPDLLEKTFAFLWQSGSFYMAAKNTGLSVMCFIHRMQLFESWLGVELYAKQKQQYRVSFRLTEFGNHLINCLGCKRIYPSMIMSYRTR